ncbi:hypothetical protein ACJKIH_15005 [Brucella pseudogrignonensis]|uniref:hypothetical protein n=1 Tax=Brucella pseudogrignonensis TaxID=419475 RepID=UPI0038B4E84C
MAVLPDYVSGTITLANGSTTVTGTGTMFQAAAFKAGDTLQIQNLTAVIASVNSNTSLTLTAPWTGTSLTKAPYRARYLPDGARVTAQTTTLIELLGNGVLTNLAEIGVEDGKVPVGNAAGEYELKSTSSFGLQDPNGSLGKLAALSLAANKLLNTNAAGDLIQSDIAAWAISMLGLAGAANKFPYLNAANTAALADITALGRALLALNGANGNIPVITGAGTVASRPIVGPVSQSGGIPTGAIVEVGGSASAGYVRFAGGLQVCWADTSNIVTTNTAVGSMFRSDTVAMGNMPVVFTAVPIVFAGGTGGAGGGWTAMEIYPTQNNWGSFSVRSATNIGTNARYFLFAIGKWHA